MARINNGITFGSGFNISAQGPIDSRMRVEYESDLTSASTWPNETAPIYNGMTVTVMETADVWVLLDKDNFQDISAWKKIGTGKEYVAGTGIDIADNVINCTISNQIVEDQEQEVKSQIISVYIPDYESAEEPENPEVGQYWFNGESFMKYTSAVTEDEETGEEEIVFEWKSLDTAKFINRDMEYIYSNGESGWTGEEGEVGYIYMTINTSDMLRWDEDKSLFVGFNSGDGYLSSVHFVRVYGIYEESETLPEGKEWNGKYILQENGDGEGKYDLLKYTNLKEGYEWVIVNNPVYPYAVLIDDASSNDYIYENTITNGNIFIVHQEGFEEGIYYVNDLNGDIYGYNDNDLKLLSNEEVEEILPEELTLTCNTTHGKYYLPMEVVMTKSFVSYTVPGSYKVTVINQETNNASIFTLSITRGSEGGSDIIIQEFSNNEVSYKRKYRIDHWTQWITKFFVTDVAVSVRDFKTPTSEGYGQDAKIGFEIKYRNQEFVKLNEPRITFRMYRRYTRNMQNKWRLIFTDIHNSNMDANMPLDKACVTLAYGEGDKETSKIYYCDRDANSPIYTLRFNASHLLESIIGINDPNENVETLRDVMLYGCNNEYNPEVILYRKSIHSSGSKDFMVYGCAEGYHPSGVVVHPSISVTIGVNVVFHTNTCGGYTMDETPIIPYRARIRGKYSDEANDVFTTYTFNPLFTKAIRNERE